MPTNLLAPRRRVHLAALGILIAAALALKAPVWQQPPQIFNDSPGYLVPALNLLSGRGYGAQEDGFRTPTLPLFLAVVLAPFDHQRLAECTDAHRPVCIGRAAEDANGALDLRMIVIAQIALGLLTMLLLYSSGWMLTHNYAVALLFAGGYAFNLAAAYWEISILSETLTLFLLVLVVWLVLRAAPGGWSHTGAVGVALAALALCHQLFMFYALVPLGFMWLARGINGMRAPLQRLAPALALPLAALVLWSGFNYAVNGFLTPSTLSGYVLIQMVAPVVENAPEGYDGITQTYVGYRDAMIRETGSHAGAIFRAWRDMMRETDLTWSQISNKLTALSLYLAFHYPGTYLESVGAAWERFWGYDIFHYDPIPQPSGALALPFTDRRIETLLNVLFFISLPVLGVVYLRARRERASPVSPGACALILYMLLTVWYAAAFSSLTNFGDNSRYHMAVLPLQFAGIVAAAWAAWRVLGNQYDQPGTTRQHVS